MQDVSPLVQEAQVSPADKIETNTGVGKCRQHYMDCRVVGDADCFGLKCLFTEMICTGEYKHPTSVLHVDEYCLNPYKQVSSCP